MTDGSIDGRWLRAAIPQHQWHFFRRVFEHYRIVLAPGDFSTMLKDIKQGRALWLMDQGNGTAIYSVVIQSVFERIYVVVAGKRHVVTALPPSREMKKLRLLRELERGRARVRVVK